MFSSILMGFSMIFHYKASILGCFPIFFFETPIHVLLKQPTLTLDISLESEQQLSKTWNFEPHFLFISHDDLYLICDKMFIAICPPGRCGLLQWAWTCGPGVQDTQGTASLRNRCSDTGLFWSSSSLVAWHGHRDFKWWDYNVQESF